MDKEQIEKHLNERFKGTKKEMRVESYSVFPCIDTGWPEKGENFLACHVLLYKEKNGKLADIHLCEENIANAHLLANAYPLLVVALKLQFLNGCEEEGINSGMPTSTEWREAFDELENVLNKILDYGE